MIGAADFADATLIEPLQTSDPTPALGGGEGGTWTGSGQRWWKFTPAETGAIRLDLLQSTAGTFYLDVYNADLSAQPPFLEGAPDSNDQVRQVEAGVEYRVIVSHIGSTPPLSEITYLLRLSALEAAEEVQAPAFHAISSLGAGSAADGGKTFIHYPGQPHPGLAQGAVDCSWVHARSGAIGSSFWMGTCEPFTSSDTAGEGAGLVGWSYSVLGDSPSSGGSAGFTTHAVVVGLRLTAAEARYNYVGDDIAEPLPIERVREVFGFDDIVAWEPANSDVLPCEVLGLKARAAELEDATGAGPKARWRVGYPTDPPSGRMNLIDFYGVETNVVGDSWVTIEIAPIVAYEHTHPSEGFNGISQTDVLDGGTPGVALTDEAYSAHQWRSGQTMDVDVTVQPRPIRVYRPPPPATGPGVTRPPRLRHLNIAPDRRGENWRGTSLRRIGSYQ